MENTILGIWELADLSLPLSVEKPTNYHKETPSEFCKANSYFQPYIQYIPANRKFENFYIIQSLTADVFECMKQ